MKPFIFLVFILLGVGRNLPAQNLYYYGLGPADLLFFLLFYILLLGQKTRFALVCEINTLKTPIKAVSYMSALAMVSMVLNAPIYGVDGRDFFEILKYLYLLTVMLVTSQCTRMTGMVPAMGFVIGVCVSGVVAFFNPMNPDVLGTPQIFNPNVIGNVLSISIVFCSFIILSGYPIRGSLLAIFSAFISFFTFSKGTWLMVILGLLACYFALKRFDGQKIVRSQKHGKFLALLTFFLLLCVIIEYRSIVFDLILAKIDATDFEASAVEGGSFSARVGLILSAVHMFLMNPVFGVGISNFEHVNQLLENTLGSAFYSDDNPNSAWFYILACMGLPAFGFFGWLFFWFLRRLYFIPVLSLEFKFGYVACVTAVFLIGGNVQLEMLTAYYYWIALGLVNALYAARLQFGRVLDFDISLNDCCVNPGSPS